MKKQLLFALTFILFNSNSFASNQIERAGDIIQIALPLTALGMTIREGDSEGRTQFYKAFSATLGTTYALKYSINRTRPNGAGYSFPSGHTSVAFSGASFIHRRYGFKKAGIAYLSAAFVGWSRIQANKHYPSDVVAGAILGTASSFYFGTDKSTNITAFKDGKTLGLNLAYSW